MRVGASAYQALEILSVDDRVRVLSAGFHGHLPWFRVETDTETGHTIIKG